MAKHLPSGHAGLEYGCAPHVRDAAELIKESWDNIQSDAIEACWKHSKCLAAQDTGSTNSEDHISRIKQSAVQQMSSVLSILQPGDPAVAHMLSSTGLDSVMEQTHELQDLASNLLIEWIQLEECAGMNNYENEEDDEPDAGELQLIEKFAVLQRVVPILQELHTIGAKLSDVPIMNFARETCNRLATFGSIQ